MDNCLFSFKFSCFSLSYKHARPIKPIDNDNVYKNVICFLFVETNEKTGEDFEDL